MLATALRFADYFELTLALMDTIPKYAQNSWRNYMKTCLKDSYSLRNLVKNTPWYGEPIKQLCMDVEKEIEKEMEMTKEMS